MRLQTLLRAKLIWQEKPLLLFRRLIGTLLDLDVFAVHLGNRIFSCTLLLLEEVFGALSCHHVQVRLELITQLPEDLVRRCDHRDFLLLHTSCHFVSRFIHICWLHD